MKKALRLGEEIVLDDLITKALGLAMDTREYLNDTKLVWSFVFPNLPLLSLTNHSGPNVIIYFTLFDNDEDLLEFKLRYL